MSHPLQTLLWTRLADKLSYWLTLQIEKTELEIQKLKKENEENKK